MLVPESHQTGRVLGGGRGQGVRETKGHGTHHSGHVKRERTAQLTAVLARVKGLEESSSVTGTRPNGDVRDKATR